SGDRSRPTPTATLFPRAAHAPASPVFFMPATCRTGLIGKPSPHPAQAAWRRSKWNDFWKRKDTDTHDRVHLFTQLTGSQVAVFAGGPRGRLHFHLGTGRARRRAVGDPRDPDEHSRGPRSRRREPGGRSPLRRVPDGRG